MIPDQLTNLNLRTQSSRIILDRFTHLIPHYHLLEEFRTLIYQELIYQGQYPTLVEIQTTIVILTLGEIQITIDSLVIGPQEIMESEGSMADEDKKPSADPFSSAVDQMHATAKWVIGIFGAIGAVLVAGTQLSSMGQLAYNDERLGIAVLAFAVGLISVGFVIWHAARVLTEGHVTRDFLERASYTASDCLDINEYASGYSINALLKGYDDDIKARNTLYDADRERDLTPNEIEQVKELNGRIQYLGGAVRQLAAAAHYNEVCKLFRSAIRTIFIAGAIGAIAMGIFAWAVNPPTPKDTTPSPAPSASPASS
jgi:hypothetical protein